MKNTVKINSVDLINADCLHFIQSLPDDSIDLIVTDPPYFKVKPNGWDNQWKGDEDYTEAEMAVLDGKSVTFNGQQMTMENLSEIRQGRQEWERRLAALITRRRGHPGYRLARF